MSTCGFLVAALCENRAYIWLATICTVVRLKTQHCLAKASWRTSNTSGWHETFVQLTSKEKVSASLPRWPPISPSSATTITPLGQLRDLLQPKQEGTLVKSGGVFAAQKIDEYDCRLARLFIHRLHLVLSIQAYLIG